MKSIKNKYYLMYDFKEIVKAHYQSRKGKRDKKDVIEFEKFLNANIIEIQKELKHLTYRLGKYNFFIIKYPKERLIMYLPYKDRLIQRVFCNTILMPLFKDMFIYDNYANQKGKGTHLGIDRFKGFLRDYYNKNGIEGYVLKADISKYFPSINHQILKNMLYPKIKDPKIKWYLDLLLDSINTEEVQEQLKRYYKELGLPEPQKGTGLPAGNIVFQTFGVYYLHSLDIFCKEELKIKYYSRYMDDFVLIHKDKEYLNYCWKRIENFLENELKLKLNPNTNLHPIKNGTNYLGWHFYVTETGKVIMKIRKESKKSVKNKIKYFNKAYKEGVIDYDSINQSVKSWLGHAEHGDTYHLRKNVLSRIKLKRKEEI